MKTRIPFGFSLALLFVAAPGALRAWNYEGHRIVNQVALASLPDDFPEWARTPANAERIAFLSGEPDRWRNTHESLLQQYNGLDHFIDLEELAAAGIDLADLTPFRYDFVAQFAAGRAAHPERFQPIDPAKNEDHTRQWPGFLPWAIAEYYAKIQSAFSYWKTFRDYGTPEEAANAEADVIYLMGVMGHYVGDGAQPLHVSIHYNGWVGPNPNGYTTDTHIHAWIDGGFIDKARITEAEIVSRVHRAKPIEVKPRTDERDPVFIAIVDYLREQSQDVEPLYQLYKAGKLKGGGPGSREGRDLIDHHLLSGAEMLGSLWLTAWRQAAPDAYLRAQLLKRRPLAAR